MVADQPLDEATLLARVGGDRELLAEVVRLFQADCPVRLEALHHIDRSILADLLSVSWRLTSAKAQKCGRPRVPAGRIAMDDRKRRHG